MIELTDPYIWLIYAPLVLNALMSNVESSVLSVKDEFLFNRDIMALRTMISIWAYYLVSVPVQTCISVFAASYNAETFK